MPDQKTTVEDLKKTFQQFVDDRDWAQFHNPKNLSINLGIEAAELQELFVWQKEDSLASFVEEHRTDIEDEVADIAFNLFQFCNQVNIDLSKAIENKLVKINKKYPIDKCKGLAKKYTEYK